MLKDLNYDIIEAISIISKSLSRYDTYMNDSAECDSCKEVWTKIKDNREEELRMLMKMLKSRMEEGQLSADENRAAA